MPESRFAQIWVDFQLEMVQQARLYRKFIIFLPNSIVSDSQIAFFQNFCFGACFTMRWNSDSHKSVQLFDWK